MDSLSLTVLLFDERATWEKDFILRELMPHPLEILPLQKESVEKLIASRRGGRLAVCFSSNHFASNLIEQLARALRPAVLIHLSDEYYPGRRADFNLMAKHCSLYLRQYNHPNYTYASNTAFVGLGYGSGMLEPTERSWSITIKSVGERSTPWAFVGALKQDREEMLNVFRRIPGGVAITEGVPIMNMRRIYEDAIFAPVGKGFFTIECFRIYESIITGCIPVVVAPPQMVKQTLTHLGVPPYLLADSWEAAREQCTRLLAQPDRLASMQRQCISYWRQHVISVRRLCRYHIDLAGFDELKA